MLRDITPWAVFPTFLNLNPHRNQCPPAAAAVSTKTLSQHHSTTFASDTMEDFYNFIFNF